MGCDGQRRTARRQWSIAPWLKPSSRSTCVMGRPLVSASRMASNLTSRLYVLRCLLMIICPAVELSVLCLNRLSTQSGEDHKVLNV
jgi:hypothetical protein